MEGCAKWGGGGGIGKGKLGPGAVCVDRAQCPYTGCTPAPFKRGSMCLGRDKNLGSEELRTTTRTVQKVRFRRKAYRAVINVPLDHDALAHHHAVVTDNLPRRRRRRP